MRQFKGHTGPYMVSNVCPNNKQESPAVAEKPARRERMIKIAPIRRAYMYNVVADNTRLSSFV